jgi:hypothetical protein
MAAVFKQKKNFRTYTRFAVSRWGIFGMNLTLHRAVVLCQSLWGGGETVLPFSGYSLKTRHIAEARSWANLEDVKK